MTLSHRWRRVAAARQRCCCWSGSRRCRAADTETAPDLAPTLILHPAQGSSLGDGDPERADSGGGVGAACLSLDSVGGAVHGVDIVWREEAIDVTNPGAISFPATLYNDLVMLDVQIYQIAHTTHKFCNCEH